MAATGVRVAAVIGLLGASTLITGALERVTGTPNASVVYLVVVVAAGLMLGTAGAIATAVAAFLLYTYFFTEPVHTFTIDDPEVLIAAVLFLFVGVVVGQLAALGRARARAAAGREREARALFQLSRVLATRESTDTALASIATALRDETGMRRVWISLGTDPASEMLAADSEDPAATGRPRPGGAPANVPGGPAGGRHRVLQRTPGDQPARWLLIHVPGIGRRPQGDLELYRVRIEASGEALGSVWAVRDRHAGAPDAIATRLLAAAADQVGQALARDRVLAAARAADVARQGDRLKTSLLQSVSHDFRTPLAVIRAAADSLGEGSDLTPEGRRANVAAIDREVEYLDRLVANLLDLSRIEAGALRARREVYDVDDLVGQVLVRLTPRLGGRSLESTIEPLPVLVDPVFLVAAVTNVLENAIAHTPPDALIRVSARPAVGTAGAPGTAAGPGEVVRLSVEDDGPGVPADALEHLFERFYRVEAVTSGSRGGLGIGLAVSRGLVQAMGGRVRARQSSLGGLAIELDLPAAVPARLEAPA
jgi:two-component system sensor histidine kinase KdpD